MTIAEVEADNKGNEIPQASELLKPLDLKGSCFTADASHTQTKMAKFIVEAKWAGCCFTVYEGQS